MSAKRPTSSAIGTPAHERHRDARRVRHEAEHVRALLGRNRAERDDHFLREHADGVARSLPLGRAEAPVKLTLFETKYGNGWPDHEGGPPAYQVEIGPAMRRAF